MSRYLPIIAFAILALGLGATLWKGRQENPTNPLIGQPASAFSLATPDGSTLSLEEMRGKPAIINFFASWCSVCLLEHPRLVELSKQNAVPIYGIIWRDTVEKVLPWLEQHGNPYQQIALDAKGSAAITLGIYGLPETFLIDKDGIVRFHHAGPLGDGEISAIQELLKEMYDAQ